MTVVDLPLAGRTVLVTRAPERARALAERLRGLGARVVVAPVTTTAPPESWAPLEEAVSGLGAYAWVAVTSVNAVDAVVAAAGRLGVELDGTRGGATPHGAAATSHGAVAGTHARRLAVSVVGAPRWAAVGPATARALRAAGIPVDLQARGTAEALAAVFPAPAQGPSRVDGSVLLPLGDLARSVLADGLRARGWDVHTVVAYRTVPVALPDDVVAAARAGQIDLAVVAAGSAARELARQLADDAPPVIAIGQPSAEAAVAAGLTVVGVADHPTDEALATAVVRAAGLHPSTTSPIDNKE